MISEREDQPTEDDDDDDEAPKPKKAKRAREKTIVFSQFTSFLDLVEPFLTNAGIQFARCTLSFFLSLPVELVIDFGNR